ncbi:hypothetical protein SCA03_15870 [Streptomyces cacaoi]|uniref:Uncharacterized protein n=1 Tax=Streptomyces cacaoi TaxID=1898 RepID=A0A4Y3QUF5_STRCI|nr:hypothetical protein SCA03_15870 [Streptomyces cacaoi]
MAAVSQGPLSAGRTGPRPGAPALNAEHVLARGRGAEREEVPGGVAGGGARDPDASEPDEDETGAE